MKDYLFKTQRLGIRNWEDEDISDFIEMGKNEMVMRYFPYLLTEKQSLDLIQRMKNSFDKKGYGYLPADILATGEFIGMIGILDQNYQGYLSNFVDIGWRLKPSAWGKGYATEGAKGWLKYAFEEIGLNEIYSVAPLLNATSENVMKKIGLEKIDEFNHPKISIDSPLCKCCLYKIQNPNL